MVIKLTAMSASVRQNMDDRSTFGLIGIGADAGRGKAALLIPVQPCAEQADACSRAAIADR